MAKRIIKIKIAADGTFDVNNAGNPDEARILKELEELAKLANGSGTGFKVEQHVHTHATAHAHTDGTIHTHG